MINSLDTKARMAEKLSIPQLQKAVQDGTLPAYIGIPLLESKMKDAEKMKAMAAGQGGPQPTIADQVMQTAQMSQGVPSLPSGLPTEEYAAGGIIAFAGGDLVDDEDDLEDDREQEQMMAAFQRILGRRMQNMEGGIGALPEAQVAMAAPTMSDSFVPDVKYSASKEPDGVSFERRVERKGDGIEQLEAEKAKVSGIDERLLKGIRTEQPSSGADDRLYKHVLHTESRGQDYDKKGNLLTSPKGAEGRMQVMRDTQRDPGFGVTPAQNNSPDEIARVGRDYLKAMQARYKEDKLAAIAYNWGPGNTDKWLMAGADPSKLPQETKKYIQGLAGGGEVKYFGSPVMNPGANQLVTGDPLFDVPGLTPSGRYAEELRRYALQQSNPRANVNAVAGKIGSPAVPVQRLPAAPAGIAGLGDGTAMGAMSSPPSMYPAGYRPGGPSASPEVMQQIDALGAQLDEARAEVAALEKQRGSLRNPNQTPGWNETYEAAVARKNALQTGYENLMSSTGMNQAAFGVPPKGALAPAGTAPKPNAMVQAMSTPQAPPSPARPPMNPAQAQADQARYQAQDIESGQSQQTERPQPTDYETGFEGYGRVVPSDAAAASAKSEETPVTSPASPYASKLEDMLSKMEARQASQGEINKYLSLLQAGLGMMGGTSPHAAVNIGQGAAQGVGTYAALAKQESDAERNILSGRLGLEKYRGYENLRKEQQDALAEFRKDKLAQEGTKAGDIKEAKMDALLERMEKTAGMQATAIIGQDKLGAMDPAAARLAIDTERTRILRGSRTYRNTHKNRWGEDPFEGVSGEVPESIYRTFTPDFGTKKGK
jgi:hypothetical protein